jgi:hypothetical protein
MRTLLRRTFALVLLATLLSASAAEREEKHEQEEREEDGCISGRLDEYLRRHSDGGMIDAETRLELARETYRALRSESRIRSEAIDGTQWFSIGPANGAGRMSRVAPHPTIAGTVLAGAAGGGVWKTTNSGATWTPLTDQIPNLKVGAVAYAPSQPSTIYVGSGEGDMRDVPGIGLIWSNDGGATWQFPSSVIAEHFFAISVHPTNPQDILIGTPRGGFRSTSGPQGPWMSVLPETGPQGENRNGSVVDFERDPSNPQIVYAATYRLACSVCLGNAQGPSILKSIDGGATWTRIMNGIPAGTNVFYDRWAIAIAPSSPSTLYAATSMFIDGELRSHIFKTTNGGASWSETAVASHPQSALNNYLRQTHYDNAIVVAPSDPNIVLAGGVFYVKSTDGGQTWAQPYFSWGGIHVDVHDMQYDAGGTLFVANDGGIWSSTDHLHVTTDRNAGLITRQFYSLALDDANRFRAFGGTQDNGTNERPYDGGSSWTEITGGDGCATLIHPAAPSYVMTTLQAGVLFRLRYDTPTPAIAFDNRVVRADTYAPWMTVLTQNPAEPSTVCTTGRGVWCSPSFGEQWYPLSRTMSGGEEWPIHVVGALAIAPSNPQVLLAAGEQTIVRSANGGGTWTSAGGLPAKNVNAIEFDPQDANVAYAALAGTAGTSVHCTTNGGVTWTPCGSGLPSYSAHVLRVDPTDRNTLYCGTDVGVYRSTDRGASWSRFGTGMPAVSVYDLRISRGASVLRAATHGRGIFELSIPGITNDAPSVHIVTPASAIDITTGTNVTFAGIATDADGVTAAWTFPDTWETKQVQAGFAVVDHVFHRGGTFVVTLVGRDPAGMATESKVVVRVRERADECAQIVDVPAHALPLTMRVSTAFASRQQIEPADGNGGTVWRRFTPPQSGSYEVLFCGSDNSARADLWQGANACDPLTGGASRASTNPGADCGTDAGGAFVFAAGQTQRIAISSFDTPTEVSVTLAREGMTSVLATVVSPAGGPASGNRLVVISGRGFQSGASVTFGGAPATNVVVRSPTILTAIVPAHASGVVDVAVTSGGVTATLHRGYAYAASSLATPSSLVATATSATQVQLTWNGVAGASYYEVFRSDRSSVIAAGTSATPSFTDNAATSDTAYLYTVRAVAADGSISPTAPHDVATTIVFTNDPLVAFSTPVRKAHLEELRRAADALLLLAGGPPWTYTNPLLSPFSVPTRALHIQELRNAITSARTRLGLAPIAFTQPAPGAGSLIRATHVTELRNAVR